MVSWCDTSISGIWRESHELIEAYVQKYDKVQVISGPVFDNNYDGLRDDKKQRKRYELSARLQYIQCFSNGVAAILHKAIDVSIYLFRFIVIILQIELIELKGGGYVCFGQESALYSSQYEHFGPTEYSDQKELFITDPL